MRRMNKRVMPRLRRRLKLWLGERQAFTADVSPTGLAVELMATLTPGATVHGRLLVGEKELPFTGLVTWVRGAEPRLQRQGRAGVRLTGIERSFYALFEGLRQAA